MSATERVGAHLDADAKPRDDQIDVYGLTHPGKVRTVNQDHFLLCSLRKQMDVYQTSLPQASEALLQDALDDGGSDNITIVVGRVVPPRAAA